MSAASEGPRGTALVVDDEVLIRMTVSEELGDHGYTCLEAADGNEGLRLIEAHPEIKLLITDVGLPNGLNGRELAQAARALRPGLPVIFITGYADDAALSGDGAQDATEVVAKPFQLGHLMDRVEALIAATAQR